MAVVGPSVRKSNSAHSFPLRPRSPVHLDLCKQAISNMGGGKGYRCVVLGEEEEEVRMVEGNIV